MASFTGEHDIRNNAFFTCLNLQKGMMLSSNDDGVLSNEIDLCSSGRILARILPTQIPTSDIQI